MTEDDRKLFNRALEERRLDASQPYLDWLDSEESVTQEQAAELLKVMNALSNRRSNKVLASIGHKIQNKLMKSGFDVRVPRKLKYMMGGAVLTKNQKTKQQRQDKKLDEILSS